MRTPTEASPRVNLEGVSEDNLIAKCLGCGAETPLEMAHQRDWQPLSSSGEWLCGVCSTLDEHRNSSCGEKVVEKKSDPAA
jgi:hypothetical protein